ncbi:hypothetical protein AAFF_G00122210 [Aldrovandia affinis]|uniref:Uncharacterized protein n=1 Tax=Aldrovandia affinis TaxID=143900 RepID=A0AAD7W9T0_9TELE|nr:hypothetical protein AAFF_G00122210 [Aldrovandia affinis]
MAGNLLFLYIGGLGGNETLPGDRRLFTGEAGAIACPPAIKVQEKRESGHHRARAQTQPDKRTPSGGWRVSAPDARQALRQRSPDSTVTPALGPPAAEESRPVI